MNIEPQTNVLEMFLTLILLTLFLWFCQVRTTIGIQKETKHNDVFYPKHYINPPRRIRRIFRVKGKMIPKFLYFRMLYYGFGFIPFSIVWYSVCFLQSNPYIRAWLFLSYWYILLCEITVFVILCLLFKYVKSKEERLRIRQMKQKQRAKKARLKQDKKIGDGSVS